MSEAAVQLVEFKTSMNSVRRLVEVAFRDTFRNRHGTQTVCVMEEYRTHQDSSHWTYNVLSQEFCAHCANVWTYQVTIERNVALKFWQHCDLDTDDKCRELRSYFNVRSAFENAHKLKVLGNTGILNCFDSRESFYRD